MDYEQRLCEGITAALVAQGALQAADGVALAEAFQATDADRFEEFLLDEEVVSKAELLKALQQFYQIPAIDVAGLLLDHALITKFPKEILLNHGFVPYQQDGDMLQVIAARPQDELLIEAIGDYVSYDIVVLVGIYRDIADAVKEFYDEALTVTHEDEEDLVEDLEEVVDEE